jgi:4-alpha-glucanotransferase
VASHIQIVSPTRSGPIVHLEAAPPTAHAARSQRQAWLEQEDGSLRLPLRGEGERKVRLPSNLRPGLYRIVREPPVPGRVTQLIVAPPRLPRPDAPRRWGLFVPVYAIRDGGTWGCGDLRALEAVGSWGASQGASVLATLPLLPAFLDRPLEPSPYRAVSRRFWNEVYLDPTETPEFQRSRVAQRMVRSREFRGRVAELERRDYVDFRGVARLKRTVVEQLLREFHRAPRSRRSAFARFVRSSEGLSEYARFRSSQDHTGTRGGEYHRFAQWLTHEQLERTALRLRRRGVVLAFDLPIGSHPSGFDTEYDASTYAQGASIGSPPDPGVPRGQDWDIRPYHPERLRDAGYRPLARAVRHALSFAPILRIDHALGFHRLFWIPKGEPPRNGGYVRMRARELYGVVLAEAARVGAEVIGEDLGTVPPELRPSLARRGLLRLYVAQYEWDGEGRPRPIPSGCVAMLNTHDQVPFAGYWKKRGSERPGRTSRRERGFPPPGTPVAEAFRIATRRLARSRARLVLVTLEDLWGEVRPQNVPGTKGRSFSRRFAHDLETLESHPEWSAFLRSLRPLRARG